jgi:hypothetical protein
VVFLSIVPLEDDPVIRVEILVKNKTYRILPNFIDGIISVSIISAGSRGTLFPRCDRISELGVSYKI